MSIYYASQHIFVAHTLRRAMHKPLSIVTLLLLDNGRMYIHVYMCIRTDVRFSPVTADEGEPNPEPPTATAAAAAAAGGDSSSESPPSTAVSVFIAKYSYSPSEMSPNPNYEQVQYIYSSPGYTVHIHNLTVRNALFWPHFVLFVS